MKTPSLMENKKITQKQDLMSFDGPKVEPEKILESDELDVQVVILVFHGLEHEVARAI
jgi:hypothetical protein